VPDAADPEPRADPVMLRVSTVKAWVKEKPGGWSPKSSLTVLKMLTSVPSLLNAAGASKS
jgi:hypothetical protein